jgi:hypothetical protein
MKNPLEMRLQGAAKATWNSVLAVGFNERFGKQMKSESTAESRR